MFFLPFLVGRDGESVSDDGESGSDGESGNDGESCNDGKSGSPLRSITLGRSCHHRHIPYLFITSILLLYRYIFTVQHLISISMTQKLNSLIIISVGSY